MGNRQQDSVGRDGKFGVAAVLPAKVPQPARPIFAQLVDHHVIRDAHLMIQGDFRLVGAAPVRRDDLHDHLRPGSFRDGVEHAASPSRVGHVQ